MLELSKRLLSFLWKYYLVFFIYLSPINGYLGCVYILLAVDFITGISKAIYNKETITSRRLRDTIIKYLFYSLAIYIGFEIDLKIFKTVTDFYFSRIIGGAIAMTEAYSILENISVLTGTNILAMVKDKIAKYVNDKMKLPEVDPVSKDSQN